MPTNHATFNRHRTFTYLMAATVLLLLLTPRRWTDPLDHVVAFLLSPISGSSQAVSLMATETLQRVDQRSVSAREHAALLEAYQRSQTQQVNLLQLVERQQQVLEQLTHLHQELGLEQASLVVAEVVGADSTDRRLTWLNRGSRHTNGQLARGQAALAPVYGSTADSSELQLYDMVVVGVIADVGPYTASLQLLNDRAFRMPALVAPALSRGESWRAPGVLAGAADGELRVQMVSSDVPVQVGDVVLADAQPEVLPLPVLVGTVRECRRDRRTPVMWEITVTPAADLATLQQVVVPNLTAGSH